MLYRLKIDKKVRACTLLREHVPTSVSALFGFFNNTDFPITVSGLVPRYGNWASTSL